MKPKKPGLMVAIGLPKGGPAPDAGAQQDSEGMGAAEGSMSDSEVCVPLSALAMPDGENGDQMANPEVGDKVTFTVDGAVTRIEGDNAYVEPEAVNGQPVEGEAGEEQGDDQAPENQADQADSQERADLQSQAGQMGPLS
jgi:hypothetical protein